MFTLKSCDKAACVLQVCHGSIDFPSQFCQSALGRLRPARAIGFEMAQVECV